MAVRVDFILVRAAKGLMTEATSLSVDVANKRVAITSQNKDEPLNKAKWIILSARDSKTEDAAQYFGSHVVFDFANGVVIGAPTSDVGEK